jgi:hypothetical protein
MPVNCPKCGNTFAAAVTNLPPWCTKCGADLPRPKPQPAGESAPDDSLSKAPPASFAAAPDEAFQKAPTAEA